LSYPNFILIYIFAGGPGENAAAQAWANAFNISILAPLAAGLEDFDFLGGWQKKAFLTSI
jgi:hypothetical protein